MAGGSEQTHEELIDPFGRVIEDLRISITDRCNERCLYCMPEGYQGWERKPDHLTADEIIRVVRVAAGMGFRKFRLTGGEPLVRADVPEIVRAIAATLLETERDPFEHPDCFILRPQGKARMIKIGSESDRSGGEWPKNSMRRLVIDIQKTANQGGRKVGIVFEADRMNVQSANAFLKTLEEPPAGTTLFLLTSRDCVATRYCPHLWVVHHSQKSR